MVTAVAMVMVMAMMMVMAMAMAMAIVCDAGQRMENAMETLQLSFRRYMASL